jgi:hypothetical protein
MKAFRTPLILVLISIAGAPVAADIDEFLKVCRQADESVPNSGLDPDEFERRVAAMRERLQTLCKPAEEAVIEIERHSRTLEYAIQHLTKDELLKPARRAYASVNRQLDALAQILAQIHAVPNILNAENNARLRDLSYRLKEVNAEIGDLDTHWDELSKPEPGGSLANLQLLLLSEQVSPKTKAAIQAYIERLPPYLVGKAVLPREKLEFLWRQSALVGVAARSKELDYTASARSELNQELKRTLGPDEVDAKAKLIHHLLLREFGVEDIRWAKIATSQGAGALALEIMLDQLHTLDHVVKRASDALRAALVHELSKEKSERERFVNVVGQKADSSRLDVFLSAYSKILETKCKGTHPSEIQDNEGLRNDISSWHNQIGAVRNEQAQAAFERMGENLWRFAQKAVKRCISALQ